MTTKEYFQQARWLDSQILSRLGEIDRLKEVSENDEGIYALHRRIRSEIGELVERKDEIRKVIDALPSEKERIAMRCRYLNGMKWDDVAAELDVDPRTVRRWHTEALKHAKVPEESW